MSRIRKPLLRQLITSVVVAAVLCGLQGTADALPVPAPADDLSSEAIQEAADRVMQQPDYRSVRRRVLENVPGTVTTGDDEPGFLWTVLDTMGTAISDFLRWMFSGFSAPTGPASPTPASSAGGSGGGFGRLFVGLAIGIVVLVVAWIIATILRNGSGLRRPNSDGIFHDEASLADLSVPPGELAASTYEGRAIQLARDGNYRAAIRELLIGSMSWIERAGLIRYRKGLTNRDYVRAIWKEEARRSAYAKTAVEFERVYFGRRTATEEMFQDCLTSFQGAFREEETPAAV